MALKASLIDMVELLLVQCLIIVQSSAVWNLGSTAPTAAGVPLRRMKRMSTVRRCKGMNVTNTLMQSFGCV